MAIGEQFAWDFLKMMRPNQPRKRTSKLQGIKGALKRKAAGVSKGCFLKALKYSKTFQNHQKLIKHILKAFLKTSKKHPKLKPLAVFLLFVHILGQQSVSSTSLVTAALRFLSAGKTMNRDWDEHVVVIKPYV